MKRFLLLLAAFTLSTLGYVNAQSIYSDGFESFTVGSGIAQQSDNWDTWSGTTGGAEDPKVSDTYAHNGTKSVKISGTNDGVIKFNNRSEGRYRIEFYIHVPSGRQGYYNILQKFTTSGVGTIWGTQAYLKNGTITVDGAGSEIVSTTYTVGTWVKIQHFIDLDNDWADMYVNDELIHAYQWSKGTFDDGTGVNKLDAINFFAWNENGTPEYYIDDITIEQVSALSAPRNLTTNLQNELDITLTWEAPAEGTPVSYTIARNGVILDTTANLTYFDEHVYPGDYDYEVYAYYGASLGHSGKSNVSQITVPGGIERNYVLYEIFTGTWCGYCPIAARAIDALAATANIDIAVLEFHGGEGDDYEVGNITDTRENLYMSKYNVDPGDWGYPASVMGGEYPLLGALTTAQAQKDYYTAIYNIVKPRLTTYELNTTIERTGTNPYTFDLNIEAEELVKYFSDEVKLYVALTETNIPHNWQNLTEVNFVVRNMFPNANGTPVDFSEETTFITTIPITVDPDFNLSKCEVVVYLQLNGDFPLILQVNKESLSGYVNSEISKAVETTVFPNPANNVLNITSDENINKIEVINIAGQIVSATNENSENVKLDVSNYQSGIYFVKIYSSNNISTHKIIVE